MEWIGIIIIIGTLYLLIHGEMKYRRERSAEIKKEDFGPAIYRPLKPVVYVPVYSPKPIDPKGGDLVEIKLSSPAKKIVEKEIVVEQWQKDLWEGVNKKKNERGMSEKTRLGAKSRTEEFKKHVSAKY